MNPVPVRVHIRIESISTDISSGIPGLQWPVYLWSIFFKIDGTTTEVNSSLKLQGTATVDPRPGNHGDLPGANSNANTLISPTLGEFVTVLTPIPVPSVGISVGGVVGYVLVLLQQLNTPDGDIPPGHQALNKAVQQGLNNLIPTLGATQQQPSPQQIQAIESQAASAVTAAVKKALGVGYKLLTFFGLQHQDDPWGDVVKYFSASQLAASAPEGIPLSDPISDPLDPHIFTFNGVAVSDPLPFSMRRILIGIGHGPPASVRAAMGSSFTTSLLAWVGKVR